MLTQKRKWLKTAKICLVALFTIILLCTTCFAVYVTTTPRDYYVPLINFEAEIERAVFDLTPTVYTINNSLNTEEAYYNNTPTSIRRNRWDIHDPSTATQYAMWREVSYRLGVSNVENVDEFTLKITASCGGFNFTSYEIPAVSCPDGYVVTGRIGYTLFYANGDGPIVHSDTFNFDVDASGGDTIELLRSYIISYPNNRDILGNVIIADYNAYLTYTKLDVENSGSGFYTWNSVLGSIPESMYESIAVDGDFWLNTYSDKPIRIISTAEDGSTHDVNVYAIVWENDVELFLRYELSDIDESIVIYNYETDSWYTVQVTDPDVGDITFTEIQLQQMYFAHSVYDTFDVDLSNESNRQSIAYFIDNTTYSPTSQSGGSVGSPETPTTDGGIYVRYIAVPSNADTMETYLKGLYKNGYINGGNGTANGTDVNFVSWAVSAIGEALAIDIFPGFSIGGMLSVVVAIGLTVVFLKFFAGG